MRRHLPASLVGVLTGAVLAACWLAAGAAPDRAEPKVLHVGSSGTLATGGDAGKEKGALESLQSFIKDETGLENEIVREKGWRDLVEKMEKGDLHLAVFQGHELARARARHADLKPLAVAVNVHRYPVAYVVTQKDGKFNDLAGLAGATLYLPAGAPGFLRLYLEKQTGKRLEAYFSKLVEKDNVEDGLDDVVDGAIGAAVVDRAALEAFKRRKPGRFNRLKELAHSDPFPPTAVAYVEGKLSDATLKRFRDGLLNASKKERGQTLLTLFRLTAFEPVPEDFSKVLERTREQYPGDGPKGK